jgi:peptidoglycan hydrolase-like protein with peptidoglycan-binding domain
VIKRLVPVMENRQFDAKHILIPSRAGDRELMVRNDERTPLGWRETTQHNYTHLFHAELLGWIDLMLIEGGITVRQLELQTPDMTGPDVVDWQMFLKNQGVFPGTVDSDFGPQSDAATRTYQTNAGLTVSGVVDADTMAKALIDGYQSTTGANIGGMDASQNCLPFATQIAAQGMKFAARYYSDNADKALTLTEAQALSAAAISVVTVFENSNDAAEFFSSDIGNSQAASALQQAATVGQPPLTAIYFAVDYDATAADVQGPIAEYFTAIKNAFAAAPTQYVIGVYGSGMTCRVMRDAGLAQFTWLTGSIGFAEYAMFHEEADIVQLAPERKLPAGLVVDDDIAQKAAFGAFTVPQPLAGVPTSE